MVIDLEHVILSLDLPHPIIEVVQLLHNSCLYEVWVQDFAGVLIHISLLELVLVI